MSEASLFFWRSCELVIWRSRDLCLKISDKAGIFSFLGSRNPHSGRPGPVSLYTNVLCVRQSGSSPSHEHVAG